MTRASLACLVEKDVLQLEGEWVGAARSHLSLASEPGGQRHHLEHLRAASESRLRVSLLRNDEIWGLGGSQWVGVGVGGCASLDEARPHPQA